MVRQQVRYLSVESGQQGEPRVLRLGLNRKHCPHFVVYTLEYHFDFIISGRPLRCLQHLFWL